MKTSNKILLILAVIAFAIPLLIAFTLKSKYEKGEFVRDKNWDGRGNSIRQSFPVGAYSVIKLDGKFRAFKINLVKDSSDYYSFNGGSDFDSISASISADTLVLKYSSKNVKNSFVHTSINLSSTQTRQILVIDADLVVDGTTLDSLNVVIDNNGFLRLGNEDEAQTNPQIIRGLNVKASSGELLIGNNVQVENAQLEMKDGSTLKVLPRAKFTRVTGSVSNDVKVEGHWSFLKQLIK